MSSKNDKAARIAPPSQRSVDPKRVDVVLIQASKRIIVFACGLLCLLILGAAFAGFSLGTSTRLAPKGSGTAVRSPGQSLILSGSTGAYQLKPGPWGDIEGQRTVIEIPDEFLSTRLHEADVPRWFFKHYSTAALSNLFNGASLAAGEKRELLDASKWEVSTAGIAVRPSQRTVLSLSQEARKNIYSVLAQFEDNPAQEQAFHWSVEAANAAFDGTDVPEQTRALVKRLSFRQGKLVMFADLSMVLRTLPTEAEKRHLEKALSRRPTLLLRLKVTPQTDIGSLAEYWARAGFGKDVRPILEAAAKIPEGTKLSILYLLPPWPTARLYSFPFPTMGAQYDCLWTAFNFFKETPDLPTTDGSFWKRKLDSEYYPVTSDPRFGDMIMLVKPDGTIIHSCTFIADDVVYTKNGASATVPWALMTIPDLLEAYASELPEGQSLRVQTYRSKNS
jgi:hypothetical protein